MNQYNVPDEAESDLIAIWFYLAEVDVTIADNTLDAMGEKFTLLATHPLMGVTRPELAPDLRSFPAGRYLIFYRLVADAIEIVRVIHGAQDLEIIFGH
jgi:toxin ParE1/3/4